MTCHRRGAAQYPGISKYRAIGIRSVEKYGEDGGGR